MLRTAEGVRAPWLFGALALAAGTASGALLAGLSSFLQVGTALLGAAIAGAVALTQAGRALDPAWVVILGLYTIGPVAALLGQVELALPLVSMVSFAPAPFAAAALFVRDRAPVNLWVATPLALLFVYGAMSLLWSADPAYGAEKLQVWIVNSVTPALFLLVLVPRAGGVSWRLIGVAGVAYALSLLFFGVETQLYPGRSVLFDGNPIWAARAAFIGSIVALFGPFPWWVKVATVPLSVVAGFNTDSLGPTLGLVVGACAGGAVWLRRAGATRTSVGLLWAVLAVASVVAFVAFVNWEVDSGTQVLAEVTEDPNVTSRARFYGTSVELFASAPIAGVGLGGFAAGPGDLYPHNLFFEVLAELGVVGTVFLGAWVVLAARGATESPVLAALLVATVVYSFFSGSLASNVEFWLVSAIAVATGTSRGARAPATDTEPTVDPGTGPPVAQPAPS